MKQFLIKLSYTVLPVFLLLFGLMAYVTLYISPRATGDLGNLACIPFNCQEDDENEMKELLFEDIRNSEELKKVHADVLTVGDSFSRMGTRGYQNYLSLQGVSVSNCYRDMYDNPFQYAYNILDKGLVDSTNIRVLVVQVGERDIVNRMETFNVDKIDMDDLEPEAPSDDGDARSNPNKWSLLRARDFLMYRLQWSPVFNVTLDRDFFDGEYARSLYFYCADVANGVCISEADKPRVKELFLLLTQKAKERGIQLILMVPVDKYDLYQDYIVDNPYPHPKTVNEDVRSILGDTPNVLLCKYVLTPLLERGEKNVFLVDDSHWSYKASEVVGKELSRRVKLLMGRKP